MNRAAIRDYMHGLKSADDDRLGFVKWDANMNDSPISQQCERNGWARWDGKKYMGARIMFLTTKGLRAMQRWT